MKMTDLGKSYSDKGSIVDSKDKLSYPSLYISGIKGLVPPSGEFTFTAKGRTVSVNTKDPANPSFEIEVTSISLPEGKKPKKVDGGDSLDAALNDIASTKGADDEEAEVVPDDEEVEGETE